MAKSLRVLFAGIAVLTLLVGCDGKKARKPAVGSYTRILMGSKHPGQSLVVRRESKTGTLETWPKEPYRIYLGLDDNAKPEVAKLRVLNESGGEISVELSPLEGDLAGFRPIRCSEKMSIPDTQEWVFDCAMNVTDFDLAAEVLRDRPDPSQPNYHQKYRAFKFGYRILVTTAQKETLDVDPEYVVEGRP